MRVDIYDLTVRYFEMAYENTSLECENEQILRSNLRENFLKKLLMITGKSCELKLHENTSVLGVFKGVDVDMQEILMSDLITPTSTLPHAIIRGSDMIAIEFLEKIND